MADPAANPRAGRRKAEAATIPAPCAVSVMNLRRVTVSPSKATGMLRSAVYLLLGSLRPSARPVGTHTEEGPEAGVPWHGGDPLRQAAGTVARKAAAAPASEARAAAF